MPAYLTPEWTATRPEPVTNTAQAYRNLVEWQAGRCAMCGVAPTTRPSLLHGTPLYLDHDYATELVRGFLCASCNLSEGQRTAGRRTAIDWTAYHARPPAVLVGLRITKSESLGLAWRFGVRDRKRRPVSELVRAARLSRAAESWAKRDARRTPEQRVHDEIRRRRLVAAVLYEDAEDRADYLFAWRSTLP